MGVKQEEENYWKMHAKWVSRRGKIKRIARKDRTHGTKPKSHSSGNLPGHEGLNGRPVCVFAVKMNSCAGKQLQRKRTYITHTFVVFVEG